MRTKFLLVLLILSLSHSIKAQPFKAGVLAGLSTSQIDGDTQKDYKKPGGYAGVNVNIEFNQLWGAKVELLYIGKGAKKVVDDIEEFNTTLHYLEMPLLITFKPINKFEFDFGLAPSYLISSKIVKYGYAIEEDLHNIHNYDLGAVFSGSYYFTEKIGINVRFEYSITPVKTEPHNWYNSNMSFGVVYKLKK